MPDQPKSLADRFLRPILASRFLTISALLHLLLVVLFGGKVLFNKYVEPPDFEATSDSFVDSGDTSPEPPPASPTEALPPAPSVSTAPPPPSVPAAMAMTTTNLSTTSFSMQAPTLTPPTISRDVAPAQPTAPQALPGQGLPSLPGPMKGRGPAGRSKLGMQYGEKNNSEQAVLKALRWLQTQQQTDGTWGEKYKGAMTGLALLCYLGHGETPDSSREFGVVVANAIKTLIGEGTKNGGRFSYAQEFSTQPSVYQHAICTYALSEAYTMTKNDKLPPLITQAVGYILKGQLPSGGWVYNYGPGKGAGDLDSSVTGWQIQALKAAHLTGLPGMDPIHPALDHAIKGLDSLFNPKDGSYGYHQVGDGNGNHQLTGVGALCKLFWQGRTDRMVSEALKNIKSKDLNYDGGDATFYAWYYDTQACFQAQGGAWEWWNHRFQDQLVNKQNPDGSWPKMGGNETGMGDESGETAVYRTALSTLMLEVFYRYLPTSKEGSMGGGGVEGL